MKKVITVKTKLNKDDKNPKVTALTLDFTGATVEQLAEPATDSLVINLQGGWRRNKAIPSQLEVKVTDLIARMGSRSQAPLTVEGVVAVSTTFTAEQRAALMAQLVAQDKAEKEKSKPSKKGSKQDGERDRPQA